MTIFGLAYGFEIILSAPFGCMSSQHTVKIKYFKVVLREKSVLKKVCYYTTRIVPRWQIKKLNLC